MPVTSPARVTSVITGNSLRDMLSLEIKCVVSIACVLAAVHGEVDDACGAVDEGGVDLSTHLTRRRHQPLATLERLHAQPYRFRLVVDGRRKSHCLWNPAAVTVDRRETGRPKVERIVAVNTSNCGQECSWNVCEEQKFATCSCEDTSP